MFCILAFIVLAFLGIFSAADRRLAKEALDCVLRRVTLRPCTTGFDTRMKSRILGSVIGRSEAAARLLNRNFEILSWMLFLLLTMSSMFALRGLYLFYVTGSCSGFNQASFCLLDPKGASNKVSTVSDSCPIKPATAADLTLKRIDLGAFPTIGNGGKERIVLIGCYGCSYTRKVYPMLKELARRSGASFTFLEYPVKVKTPLMTSLGQCIYRLDRGKYWALNDKLFAVEPSKLDEPAYARKVIEELGCDWGVIDRCLQDPATGRASERQLEEVTKTRFYGTPTVFVNDRVLVGPKPYRIYAIALKGLIYW